MTVKAAKHRLAATALTVTGRQIKRQLSTSKDKHATKMLQNIRREAPGSAADGRYPFLTRWNIINGKINSYTDLGQLCLLIPTIDLRYHNIKKSLKKEKNHVK